MAAERSNYALFLSELCDLIGVPRPDPATPDNAKNSYVIDRAVTRLDKDGKKTTVYLDLYKSGHFVLETKQGSSAEASNLDPAPLLDVASATQKAGHGKRGTKAWDKALEKAYHQARAYSPYVLGMSLYVFLYDMPFLPFQDHTTCSNA